MAGLAESRSRTNPLAIIVVIIAMGAALVGCDREPERPRGPFTGRLAIPGEMRAASVAFSPDGRIIATGGVVGGMTDSRGTLRLWDATTGGPLGDPLDGHQDTVSDLAFSPDGKTLASASWDGTVRLWDLAGRQPSGEPIKAHDRGVWAIAFSPDGKNLATGGGDATARLWDVATGRPVGAPFSGHTKTVSDVSFSPDGRTLGTGGRDAVVQLWDVATHQPVGAPLMKGGSWPGRVAFSPDRTTAAVVSADLKVWDFAAQRFVSELDDRGYDGEWYPIVVGTAFSPDSKTIMIIVDETLINPATQPPGPTPTSGPRTDKRYTVRLWDVATGKLRGGPVTTQAEDIWSAAFSPDGRRIAWLTSKAVGVEQI